MRNELGDVVKFYKEYNVGHFGFMVGKDMEHVEDVIKFFDGYQ